jgi:hypothetical protein
MPKHRKTRQNNQQLGQQLDIVAITKYKPYLKNPIPRSFKRIVQLLKCCRDTQRMQ